MKKILITLCLSLTFQAYSANGESPAKRPTIPSAADVLAFTLATQAPASVTIQPATPSQLPAAVVHEPTTQKAAEPRVLTCGINGCTFSTPKAATIYKHRTRARRDLDKKIPHPKEATEKVVTPATFFKTEKSLTKREINTIFLQLKQTFPEATPNEIALLFQQQTGQSLYGTKGYQCSGEGCGYKSNDWTPIQNHVQKNHTLMTFKQAQAALAKQGIQANPLIYS